jgi:ABC-type phosphate transport system permease subunit
MATGEAAPLLPLGGLTFITFNPTGAQSPVTVPPIQIFSGLSVLSSVLRRAAVRAFCLHGRGVEG